MFITPPISLVQGLERRASFILRKTFTNWVASQGLENHIILSLYMLWKSSWSVPLENFEHFSFCSGESVPLKTLDYKQNKTNQPVVMWSTWKNFKVVWVLGNFYLVCNTLSHPVTQACKHTPGSVGPEGSSSPLEGLFLGKTVPLSF